MAIWLVSFIYQEFGSLHSGVPVVIFRYVVACAESGIKIAKGMMANRFFIGHVVICNLQTKDIRL